MNREGAVAANAAAAPKWKRNHYYRKDAFVAAVILTPMLLWWLIIYGFPVGFAFILGFFDWNGLTLRPSFVGLRNFIEFFRDATYLGDLWRSIWIGGLTTCLTIVTGFGAALLMNLPIKARGLYRTLWYVPVVTSTIATTQILRIFMDPASGVLNNLLAQMGRDPMLWTNSVFWGILFICVYSVWKGVGGTALIWLAGLQSVDPVLYEAAEIDGAGRWAKFRHVTIPGVKPIATFIIITGLIAAVQIYEQVAFITVGEPYGQTQVLVFRILRDGFFDFNLGMAGASSLILTAIVFTASVAYYKSTRDKS